MRGRARACVCVCVGTLTRARVRVCARVACVLCRVACVVCVVCMRAPGAGACDYDALPATPCRMRMRFPGCAGEARTVVPATRDQKMGGALSALVFMVFGGCASAAGRMKSPWVCQYCKARAARASA